MAPVVAALVGVLSAATVIVPFASAATVNPLRTVTVTPSDVVQVTFVLPPSMVPYAIHFDTANWGPGGGADHEVDLVLPSLPPGNPKDPSNAPVNFGTTRATSWTSPTSNYIGVLLRDGPSGATTTWSVTLAYAPKATCIGVHSCPGIRRSQSITLRTQDTLKKPPPTPSSTTTGGPTYLTTGGIEQAIEQNGLTDNGVHHATLYVGCTGQGYAGANMVDPKLGINQPSYDKFLCTITLAGDSVTLIHIQMGHDTYSWQAIG